MTIPELEQVILDYLKDMYHKRYIGKLSIQKLEPEGYYIKMGMNTPNQPIVIYAELPDDEFLKFLKRDLKDRRFNLVDFGELRLQYHTPCEPINPKCECNDKG